MESKTSLLLLSFHEEKKHQNHLPDALFHQDDHQHVIFTTLKQHLGPLLEYHH